MRKNVQRVVKYLQTAKVCNAVKADTSGLDCIVFDEVKKERLKRLYNAQSFRIRKSRIYEPEG